VKVVLQQATPDDCPAMGKILSDWVGENDWMPRMHPRESYPQFCELLINIGAVTVARMDGRVAGFLALQDNDIQALYLARDARGQGIGKRLLSNAKDQTDHLELWTFQANLGARRFYAREGFREVELTDGSGNDEKLPDVRLAWARKKP